MLALSLGATAIPVRAAPPAAVTVAAAADGCPAAGEIAAAVGQLLPTTRVSVAPGPPGAVTVRVDDLDDRYRVRVDGVVREVPEAARDCAERARTASVIIALALDPPAVTPDAPAVARAPVAVTRPAPAPASRRWRVLLQATLTVAAAPDVDAVDGVTPGGAVRALVGGARFGVGLGVGAAAPLTVRLTAGKVDLWRVPCDLDVYGALRRGRWEGAAEVGLGLGVLRMVGRDLTGAAAATRLDLGVRLAATARWWAAAKLAPFLGIEALVVPSPHRLLVSSVGVAGHTPRAWLTALAGIAVRVH